MEGKKYLDYDGLKDYHEKLKTQISENIEKVEDKIPSMSFDDAKQALVIG